MLEKWLKLALVQTISVEHSILKNLFPKAKKPLLCTFLITCINSCTLWPPMWVSRLPQHLAQLQHREPPWSSTCLWVSSRKSAQAAGEPSREKFRKWGILKTFLQRTSDNTIQGVCHCVKMAESAQPSYSKPILIRALYFHLINKCWPMNSNWTFMIFVFYRMHNDSVKMLQINLFHLLSYFMLDY